MLQKTSEVISLRATSVWNVQLCCVEIYRQDDLLCVQISRRLTREWNVRLAFTPPPEETVNFLLWLLNTDLSQAGRNCGCGDTGGCKCLSVYALWLNTIIISQQQDKFYNQSLLLGKVQNEEELTLFWLCIKSFNCKKNLFLQILLHRNKAQQGTKWHHVPMEVFSEVVHPRCYWPHQPQRSTWVHLSHCQRPET